MSMNVSQEEADEETPLSEINTTPLVDVMLVLLIVFLITIPVVTATVRVNKPRAANIETQTKPENINISIDANGDIYLGTGKLGGYEQLREIIRGRANEKPQPEVHIIADRETRYEAVGRTIVAVQRGGIVKVGFITEPPP
ncbi:MAG: biopolymer transporter ExbD, partial [Candidatus Obscuribacterales bacterium]|nr:biopolymer transporter ExbD [Steroidobacteraceae bacterium]